MIKNREIDLVLNTPLGKQQRADDYAIRAAAVPAGIPCITTRAGHQRRGPARLPRCTAASTRCAALQDHHAECASNARPLSARR